HGMGQDKLEKRLIDRLTENACPVQWVTRLTTLRQDDNAVTVALERNGGRQQWVCKWVVGADGINSTVRTQLQIPFEGKTDPEPFFLADVTVEEADHRRVHYSLAKKFFLEV